MPTFVKRICAFEGLSSRDVVDSNTDETGAVTRGSLHHIELWTPDVDRSTPSWSWLLESLGYRLFQTWEFGRSWRLGETYIVIEQSPALSEQHHDRLRPGLNHLAFHAGNPAQCEELVAQSLAHGWTLLFQESHPHAGGPDHYAGFLTDQFGFEVELVATQ